MSDFDNNQERKESNIINNSNKETIEKDIQNKSKEKEKKVKIKRTVYDENAPYDNTSVGAAGIVFGPIAGAILSYISLRNLGDKNAKYVLLGGFGITILLTYLVAFIIPDSNSLKFGFLWLIFMLFQQKQVKKWAEDNPDKKYKSGLKALGWALLGGIIFFGTVFITILIITISQQSI